MAELDALAPANQVSMGRAGEKRRTYQGVEYGTIPVPLTELMEGEELQVYPEVLSKGCFTIRPKKNRLIFAAGKYVGLIPINGRVAIEVRPRMPISSLTRMLSVAGLAPNVLEQFSETYSTSRVTFPSLLNLFAMAIVEALRDIDTQGVYREYVSRRADTSLPKGRILLGETIRRHWAKGVSHRVAGSWFDRSADNAPNQLLKYAVWYVAHQLLALNPPHAGVKKLCARLNTAYGLFRGVSLWKDRRFLSDRAVIDPDRMPPSRDYYRPTMRLALAVIRGSGLSFDEPGEDVRMPCLLLNLEDVFEAYLRNTLRRLLTQRTQLAVLDGNLAEPVGGKKPLFDAPPSVDVTPDVVLRRVGGEREKNEVIIDAKYKPYYEWPDREDLNQVITYAASYRCAVAMLAHPWRSPNQKGLRKLGQIGGVTVYSYALDLSDGDLAQAEEMFTEAVRGLVSP